MSNSDTIVAECGHPCRLLAEKYADFAPEYQWRFRTWCCRCENREPCSICAPLDTPEDRARREESYEIGRQFMERIVRDNPDVWAPFIEREHASVPAPVSSLNWRRGLRRLSAVLVITLSALLGLLLWLVGFGVVFVWLMGLAAVVWSGVWAARWVITGFQADSSDTAEPRGPTGGGR